MMNYLTSFYPSFYPTQNALLYGSHPAQTLAIIPPNLSNTPAINEEDDTSRVRLAREDLLRYSSSDYDDYIRKVTTKRPLSEKEHRESKKQRRLIKNREYAQISRNKKKTEYVQLSSQIDQLTLQNNELNERVHQLETENNALKAENKRYQEFMSNLPIQPQFSEYTTNCTPPQPDSPSSQPDSPLESQSSIISQSPPLTPTSSEESNSFDLFSEVLSDDIFSSDWSTLSAKVPFPLFTIFFCLILFSPSSMVRPLPQNPNYPNTIPPASESPSPAFNRHLLNTPQDVTNSSSDSYDWSSYSSTSGIISIEDVLEDEFRELQSHVKFGHIENTTIVEKNYFNTNSTYILSSYAIISK